MGPLEAGLWKSLGHWKLGVSVTCPLEWSCRRVIGRCAAPVFQLPEEKLTLDTEPTLYLASLSC